VAKREKKAEEANNIIGNIICIPNLHVKIPKVEHARIVARVRAGETQRQIAADYKTTRQQISQIVKRYEVVAVLEGRAWQRRSRHQHPRGGWVKAYF
jgi:hypothetical protein